MGWAMWVTEKKEADDNDAQTEEKTIDDEGNYLSSLVNNRREPNFHQTLKSIINPHTQRLSAFKKKLEGGIPSDAFWEQMCQYICLHL